jgi:DNA polymerase III alpha subunit (gram-positive type)
MTNNQLLNLSAAIDAITNAHFDNENKVNLSDKLFYALKKNSRMVAPILKENQSIIEDYQSIFKKNEKVDEDKLSEKEYSDEVNAKYKAFVSEPKNIEAQVTFLNEESSIELYKVSLDDLDASILPLSDSAYLESLLV